MPYAEAAGEYLMHFIKAVKFPRKLKVCFSNSPENETHATFRDLGFVSRPDHTFDVYIAGGLGIKPCLGLCAAKGISPEKTLYYVKAMVDTFVAYGNYENRSKARTRFMQEALGAEKLLQAYEEKLSHVFHAESLDLPPPFPAQRPQRQDKHRRPPINGLFPKNRKGFMLSFISLWAAFSLPKRLRSCIN